MVTLRLDGLSFSYDSQSVFSHVDIEINTGEVVSIVGRNGAGKSTLLKCINHILTPAGGSVIVGSQRIDKLDHRRRARTFGYLSQKNEYVFPATVFEVVLTGRYPHSPLRFTRHDHEVVAETLAAMGLDNFAERTFDHLSGGEQQQVLIARALAQKARILLFDEPTNNLDLHHQLDIMHCIRTVARHKGVTSILAIHDLNLAAAFSDRILIMHDRTVRALGRPTDVLTPEMLWEVFGVNAKVYDHDGTPHVVVLPHVSPANE